mgnify:CR=1 FL=1
MEVAKPVLEFIAPMVPGEIFPYFFTMEMFQRALVAAVLVTLVAGVLGSFLLVRNLALIGDGLAHVSFGGVAVGVVLGNFAESSGFANRFSILDFDMGGALPMAVARLKTQKVGRALSRFLSQVKKFPPTG